MNQILVIAWREVTRLRKLGGPMLPAPSSAQELENAAEDGGLSLFISSGP